MPHQTVNQKKKTDGKRRKSTTASTKQPCAPVASIHPILQLQKTIGNQAVHRLIKSGGIQAKLKISQPGDFHELEADRISEQVIGMVEPRAQYQEGAEEVNLVQAKTVSDPTHTFSKEFEEKEDDKEKILQAEEITGQLPKYRWNTEARITQMRGGGLPLPKSVRAFFEPRFGYDFSRVRIHTNDDAANSAQEMNARAYTVGNEIVFGANEYTPETKEGKLLLAHELTHVIQQSSHKPSSSPVIMRGAKGEIVGWLVKVGERKLIKRIAIYSEKELTQLLAKGYSVLVKEGSAQAKRIAKKVWGDNIIHHTGHIIKKTGKKGLSHFQPAKHLLGKPGEKGWHIFYSAIPVLFLSEDVDAMEVYEDKYPGQSIAHYLTVTKYVGEDSWLSYLDWINPGELIAIGGDIGRNLDRERTKELKAIVFNRTTSNGTIQTYELNPEGELVHVYIVNPDGKKKILSADEYFTFLGTQTNQPQPVQAAQDGTKHRLYQSTFDADYRIYISKQGWAWDGQTLSFFLPMDYAKKLQKIGEFYVMENLSIDYVYAYVHPRHRVALHQPGFLIPKPMVEDYDESDSKEEFLQKMLTSAIKSAELKKAEFGQPK